MGLPVGYHSCYQVPAWRRGNVPTFERPEMCGQMSLKVGSWFFFDVEIFAGVVLLRVWVPNFTCEKCRHVGIHVILGI